MDAGRPEHDEGDECIEYDPYGWFQCPTPRFATPRSSVGAPPHDLEQAEGWEAAVLKLEERLKMARTAMGD